MHVPTSEKELAEKGIDPVLIKVLKTAPKLSQTFISTQEFEQRLQLLFSTCNNDLVQAYANEASGMLWVADANVAKQLESRNPGLAKRFEDMAKDKLTNVKGSDSLNNLGKYLSAQLKAIKKELAEAQKAVERALEKDKTAAEKLADNYRELLWKREKYRMEKYSFTWTDTGWVNIDKLVFTEESVIVKKKIKILRQEPIKIEVHIKNGGEMDYSNVYIVMRDIHSVYRLNANGNDPNTFYENFVVGLMRLHQEKYSLVAIGYKNGQPYWAEKSGIMGAGLTANFTLQAISREELKTQLAITSSFSRENRLDVDMAFQQKLFEERQRQQQLVKDEVFMKKLRDKAFPCGCDTYMQGRALFESQCASCHAVNYKLVAPALAGAESRYNWNWILEFTHNSQRMIARGDKQAVKTYKEHNGLVMNSFENLSDQDIREIFNFIDCETGTEIIEDKLAN